MCNVLGNRHWRINTNMFAGARSTESKKLRKGICTSPAVRSRNGGEIARHAANSTACRKVFVSFGGLLLYIDGPWRKLANIKMDHAYLLIKR